MAESRGALPSALVDALCSAQTLAGWLMLGADGGAYRDTLRTRLGRADDARRSLEEFQALEGNPGLKEIKARAEAMAAIPSQAGSLPDPSLSFDFPDPEELRPPLITLDMASVGYADKPILKRLMLRIDPNDRIALLGRNGNGKTTLARLIAAQLAPMEGEMFASGQMKVGYFTQYQVEELAGEDTPLEHMTRVMKDRTPGAVRAQLGRFGFSGPRATQAVDKLSGGERARLALALITYDAPHLLILDEPTNHLDLESITALNNGLISFSEVLLFASHDHEFVSTVANRIVEFTPGGVIDRKMGFDDYLESAEVAAARAAGALRLGVRTDPPARRERGPDPRQHRPRREHHRHRRQRRHHQRARHSDLRRGRHQRGSL